MKLSTRVTIFVIMFLVLSGVVALGSTASLSPQDAASLSSQAQSLQPTTLGIYTNNVRIALGEFIPVLGPAFGIYVSYSTGVVLAAIAQSQPTVHITGLESFLVLIITPIFWMEFFAYSLATEESISLIISLKRREFFKSEWKWLLLSLLLVVTVLLVSARLEASLVNFFQ